MLKNWFPILTWLPQYKKSYLKKDSIAGIIVGILLIPQGMAYALIAGLPPQYGLYAALIPQVIYTFTGTSKQLAVGPVAMDSLLISAGLSSLAITNTPDYINAALILSLYIGIILFVLSLLKAGVLVSLLSKPVISGFTSAIAIIIVFSQFKNLSGIDLNNKHNIFIQLQEIFIRIPETHLLTLCFGISTLSLILILKRTRLKIIAAVIAIFISTLISFYFKLDQFGLDIIKSIPAGLPKFKIHTIDWILIKNLTPTAITIALIAFMEAISISKSIETADNDSEIDANQELFALGISNIIGSFFQAYPTTGGFSRTAVNIQSGAKTNIASIISAIVIGLILLFFTPLFYYLPKTVLAVIIILAVIKLIDIKYAIKLFKNIKQEFLLLIGTFLSTLFIGAIEGLLIGVAFSIALIIYRTSTPHIAVLGNIKGTDYFKNVNRFQKDIIVRPDILIIRFDAQLNFANKDYFKSKLLNLIQQKNHLLRTVIINAEAISYIDSSANDMLLKTISQLKAKKINIVFTGTIGPVRDLLFNNGVVDIIGTKSLFVSISDAICFIDSKCSPSNMQQKITQQNDN